MVQSLERSGEKFITMTLTDAEKAISLCATEAINTYVILCMGPAKLLSQAVSGIIHSYKQIDKTEWVFNWSAKMLHSSIRWVNTFHFSIWSVFYCSQASDRLHSLVYHVLSAIKEEEIPKNISTLFKTELSSATQIHSSHKYVCYLILICWFHREIERGRER